METNLKKCPCGSVIFDENIRCSMCMFKLTCVIVDCGGIPMYIPLVQWEAWKKGLNGK